MSNNTTCFLFKASKFDNVANYDSFALYVAHLSHGCAVASGSGGKWFCFGGNLEKLDDYIRISSYINPNSLGWRSLTFALDSSLNPFYVANQLIHMADPALKVFDKGSWPTFYLTTRAIGYGFATYFSRNFIPRRVQSMKIDHLQ